ncbi:uncharacterized protein LOC126687717 [Mercurialis annua]|uniref:uncharacterized protein LOC126687717 n=1 Tax=Mercurialis annua TaxID=3986 RepID=UPI00215E8263|nr:uncharacterized protein LOC126687717 [Mercurialis annua]
MYSHDYRSRYDNRIKAFTPLNTKRVNVLIWVKESRTLVTWPIKMVHITETRDENRYCKFHEDYGHDTEECYDLKKEIEKLIESGALRKFINNREEKEQRKEGADNEEKKEEPKGRKKDVVGVVNIILGGKGEREGRKKLRAEIMKVAEQAGGKGETTKVIITFLADDGLHVKGPHNDALVIEAIINKFLVIKLLIDEGCAVNFMTWETYKRIGGELGKLKNCPVPIMGLGGAPIQPRGLSELMIEFGKGEKEAEEIKTLFSVVVMPLAYNGILGRPFLYDSGAITSIRSLVMKIPTPGGVINMKGDLEIVAKCYTIAMKETKG